MIEVLEPASTLDLVTPDMVTRGWDEVDDLSSDEVELAIAASSRSFNHWCGRVFSSQRYLETMEASHTLKLILREGPISDVSEVLSMGAPVIDYIVDKETSILHKNNMIPWYGPLRRDGVLRDSFAAYDIPLSLTVDYIAGYITQPMIELDPTVGDKTIPVDLEYACIVQSRIVIKGLRGMPVGIPQSIVVGPYEAKHATVDSMVGSGSGYWATAIADPTIMWLPLEVRRTLVLYRRTF